VNDFALWYLDSARHRNRWNGRKSRSATQREERCGHGDWHDRATRHGADDIAPANDRT
jgi:hypothetical protein